MERAQRIRDDPHFYRLKKYRLESIAEKAKKHLQKLKAEAEFEKEIEIKKKDLHLF
jgi:hypothetical protein